MQRISTFLFTITLIVATTLSGTAESAGQSFGAIAYSPQTGAMGWSYDFGNQRQAERRALSGCAKRARDCRVAIWFSNGCGAVAVGSSGWGSGWGGDRNRAEYEAMGSCAKNSYGCRVVRWQCSGAR
ncbi:DUF4189 domain-containing protein [Ciceribacter sp. L1K22]|uniref:DUF4189 domain-containing protein n=1 Tax=Ciceribacter sp. L1K22 TaxID=2820275 RepID=UPI001ABE5EA0|nr:DUF4189 domain-containing protein [Ciceribacter sp. L1K22]MBO3760741.1 DUF4189 domain-containing protein [Ciceribacter sp. L1K22]